MFPEESTLTKERWLRVSSRTTGAPLLPTVDVCVLDVDGLRGQFVSRGQSAVDGGEDLQDTFGEAGLKHHAAAPHTYVLTAWVQVGNTH